MDKRTKKRISTLRERFQNLQRMLAGAKRQRDEPDEIRNLERQLAKTSEELAALSARRDGPG